MCKVQRRENYPCVTCPQGYYQGSTTRNVDMERVVDALDGADYAAEVWDVLEHEHIGSALDVMDAVGVAMHAAPNTTASS